MNEWILLAIFVGVALLACSIGFKKFVWFLSVGYGFAVAALGIGYAIYSGIHFHGVDLMGLLFSILLVLYGARLSGFLLAREIKNASYRKVLKEATKEDEKKMPIFVLVTIWIMVGFLYVMQTAPVFYRTVNADVWVIGHEFDPLDVIVSGVALVISAAGLLIETLADFQKTAQKKENPHMVATKNLYKMVRCPNYFGEILFWTGIFLSGLIACTTWYHWLIAGLGWICIVYIMINGAQRLDKRQEKNYGSKEEYRAYADHTPLIFPLLPIYHIGAYKPEDLEAIAAKKAAKKAVKSANKEEK